MLFFIYNKSIENIFEFHNFRIILSNLTCCIFQLFRASNPDTFPFRVIFHSYPSFDLPNRQNEVPFCAHSTHQPRSGLSLFLSLSPHTIDSLSVWPSSLDVDDVKDCLDGIHYSQILLAPFVHAVGGVRFEYPFPFKHWCSHERMISVVSIVWW